MRNPRVRIVDHHGQLVCPLIVSASQHEVADLGGQVLRLLALPAVLECDHRRIAVRDAQAPCARRFAMQAAAAGAGVGKRGVACVDMQQRVGNLFARAAAWIDQAGGLQLLQGFLIARNTVALPDGWLVCVHAEMLEGRQNLLGRAWDGARPVDVFNAYQPRAAMRARVQPACKRAHQ